jgi:hypothetical protein
MKKKKGTIILSPPWPRSGTSNIIAAQTLAHSKHGERVFLLLEPIGPWLSRLHRKTWRRATTSMKYRGVDIVDYPRTNPMIPIGSLRRFFGFHDDAITAVANYVASGGFPETLISFINRHEIDVIRVNHVFGMQLALKLKQFIYGNTKRNVRIVLDTHDVQSDAYFQGARLNITSGRPDPLERMLAGELALAGKADALAHISPKDFQFFFERTSRQETRLFTPNITSWHREQVGKR